MCPACLTIVALIAAGASSAGGLTALVVGALRPKGGHDAPDLPSPSASRRQGDGAVAEAGQ